MRQIAVIGLGNFGSSLARELAEGGAEVIAIDRSRDRVEAVKEIVTCAISLNATDEVALRAAGVHEVDVAVVCIGVDIEANLLTTLLMKKLGVRKVWARAISPLQREILKALQVSNIINIEEDMGKLVARSLVYENVFRHGTLGPGYSLAEVRVPSTLGGKTFRSANLREAYRVNIVAVKKRRPQITATGERTFEEILDPVPSADAVLDEEDVLVVAGREEDVARFSRL